ncbi:MAG: hypothetical protein ACKVGT_04720 [Flavobacteriales bacterium]
MNEETLFTISHNQFSPKNGSSIDNTHCKHAFKAPKYNSKTHLPYRNLFSIIFDNRALKNTKRMFML